MKKSYLITFITTLILNISNAQISNPAMQFSGLDCNGNSMDLYADLDSGKAVILHFFMPGCGSCIPVAQKMQAMAQTINSMYSGMVKGFAFPSENSTTCSYTSNWVISNNLSTLYAPVDSGATQVDYYGSFGMPSVVVLGGLEHQVLFYTENFVTSDTTTIKETILSMFQNANGVNDFNKSADNFQLFPNPTNDILNISIESQENPQLSVDITDLTGKIVLNNIADEEIKGSSVHKINTTQLSNGNYLARVNLNGLFHFRKLIVIH